MREHSLKSSDAKLALASWNWFRIVKVTGQFALGGVLLWFIVERVSIDWRSFGKIFAHASFIHLSWAIACFALSILLKPLQYSLLLPIPIRKNYMLGVILSQHALLTFLPWRLGEISLPVLLRQDQNVPLVNSISSVVAIRCGDLLIIAGVALVGIQRLGFEIGPSTIVWGIGAAAVLLTVAEITSRRLHGLSFLRILTTAVQPLFKLSCFGTLLFLSLAIFFLSTLQSMFALRAFGLAMSFGDVAVLNALTLLAALLPIHPPGGWGTIDSIQIVILQYLNYRPEQSGPVILAAHCFYTLVVFLGGCAGWAIRGRSIRP
jgi:hypothetical protein